MRKYLIKFWFLAIICCFQPIVWAEKMATPESINGTTRISAEQLIDLVDEFDNLVIIDSRIDKDRAAGHIEGSFSLPDIKTTPESLSTAIPSKETPVAFYCNGVKCGRSVKASTMAVNEGYKNVYWFRGGWEEWIQKGLPISK